MNSPEAAAALPSLGPRTDADRRRALVLSGGGIRCSYQVGALCALQEVGLGFATFDATSGGGLNLAMLLSGLTPQQMQQRWRQLDLKRSLSMMPLRSYLRQDDCLAMGSADAFRRKVLPDLGIDLAAIRRAGGVHGNFNVLDYSCKLVREIPHTQLDEDLLIAGMSLPGVMPPVLHQGSWFLDAAFVQDANLMMTVRAGAEELWVLWCLGNSGQYRGGPLHIYVQMLEMAAHGALHRELLEIAALNARIAAGDSPYGQRQPVRVHLIRPDVPLPLDPEVYLGRVCTADLMALGYRDAWAAIRQRDTGGRDLDPAITRQQLPVPGLRFAEALRGTVRLAGAPAGTESLLTLRCRAHIDDFQQFLRGSKPVALLHGEIDYAPFGTAIPCLSGSLGMETDGDDAGADRLRYTLMFQHEGKDYCLAGHKVPGRGLRAGMSPMTVALHAGRDSSGPVLGTGVLKLGSMELLKRCVSLRTSAVSGWRARAAMLWRGCRLLQGLRSVALVVATAITTQYSEAQVVGIAGLQPSSETSAIRRSQLEQANAAGVTIRFADVGRRSETWLDAVPPGLLGPRLESEEDLLRVIEDLYPFFGFRGTEVLSFYRRSELRPLHGGRRQIEYTFREDIAGIPSNQFIYILVDAETQRLDAIAGSPHLDRQLERSPRMPAQQAIDYAIAWVRSGANPDFGPIAASNLDGPHQTMVVYEAWGSDRALTPVWLVELVSPEARDERRHLLVRPDGRVTGTEIALYR